MQRAKTSQRHESPDGRDIGARARARIISRWIPPLRGVTSVSYVVTWKLEDQRVDSFLSSSSSSSSRCAPLPLRRITWHVTVNNSLHTRLCHCSLGGIEIAIKASPPPLFFAVAKAYTVFTRRRRQRRRSRGRRAASVCKYAKGFGRKVYDSAARRWEAASSGSTVTKATK